MHSHLCSWASANKGQGLRGEGDDVFDIEVDPKNYK